VKTGFIWQKTSINPSFSGSLTAALAAMTENRSVFTFLKQPL
jgi:hypothetical protein